MKLHSTTLAYMSCALLSACGITAPDSSTSSLTYVTSNNSSNMPAATVNTTAGSDANTTGTGTTTGSGGDGNTTLGPATDVNTTSTAGTTTSGGTTTGGSTTSGTTTSGSTTPTYTVVNLSADMNSVLQSRSPHYSTQNLGNPANIALWTSAELQSLYDGLIASQAYYPNLALSDLSHLILALGATDSTGDYTLSGSGGTGYLQVSSSSSEQDYINHGLAISGPDGQLVSPSSISLTTPGANLAIMAWYTRNAVSAGESANQAAICQSGGPAITRDVGNALLSWLLGPGYDRNNLSGADETQWQTFYNRNLDYYYQAGFGNQASFDAILSTSMPSALENFANPPSNCTFQ